MGILIDSDVLIAAERKVIDLEPLLAVHAEDRCFVSVITFSELLLLEQVRDVAVR